MSSFGAPFCRGIEPFLQNLQALLEQAGALGISGDPTVVSAQAVYDDISGYVLYIPLVGDACDTNTAEVQATIARLTPVVAAAGGNVSVPRPDAQAPTTSPSTWLMVAGFGVLGIVALHYLSPLWSGRRRSTAGYRRLR